MGIMKYVVVGIGVALICAMTFFFTGQESGAQQCRIVRVYSTGMGGPAVRIEPSNVLINKDTCLIWVNLGKAEIQVIFDDGKTCADATDAPSAFAMVESCYVTSWVAPGATSSLTFKEEGTYNYEVAWKEAGTKEKGKIIVQ